MDKSENKNEGTVSLPKIVLEVDAFPFKGLNISEEWEKLGEVEGRTVCSLCKKSRKYFCYTCYVAVPEIQDIVPKVKLPLRIDIIKHAREMDGKSTAVHAAVLAPEDVRIFTYPCIPNYDPEENVVLIYPNKDAVSVEELYNDFFCKANSEPQCKKRCMEQEPSVIHRAVFVDSTWNQSRGILKDSRMKSLPSVVLKSRLSQFWRHQADSPRWYLATIEAIHQFLVELDAAQWKCNHRTTGLSADLASESVSLEVGGPSEFADEKESEDKQETEPETNILCEKRLEVGGPSECADEKESEDKQETGPETNILCDKSTDDLIGQTSYTDNEMLNNNQYCYKGQFDNLLFFFRFMYSMIHTLYDHDNLKSYKRRLE